MQRQGISGLSRTMVKEETIWTGKSCLNRGVVFISSGLKSGILPYIVYIYFICTAPYENRDKGLGDDFSTPTFDKGQQCKNTKKKKKKKKKK